MTCTVLLTTKFYAFPLD